MDGRVNKGGRPKKPTVNPREIFVAAEQIDNKEESTTQKIEYKGYAIVTELTGRVIVCNRGLHVAEWQIGASDGIEKARAFIDESI